MLLKREGKVVDSCFEHWKQKRTLAAATLTPPLRTEKKDGSALHDPYVAFRRRVEKMQTRKVCDIFTSHDEVVNIKM